MKWPAKLLLAALCGCLIVLVQKLISDVGDYFTITESGHKQFVWGLPLAVSHSSNPSLDDSTAAILAKSAINVLSWSLTIVLAAAIWKRAAKVSPDRA